MDSVTLSQLLDLKGIRFEWPLMLMALMVLPLLVAYWWRQRVIQSGAAMRYPGLRPQSERREARVPWLGVLFLLGTLLLILAVARPHAQLAMPNRQMDIMLVIDTSASMRADDVKPNRLAAAKQITHEFIDNLPKQTRVGLVAVAASAQLAQSPTHDREALRQAVDRLDAQRGTALGSGIAIALATLRPDANLDVEYLTTGRSSKQFYREPVKPDLPSSSPVPAGSEGSMAIIVMSDGKPTLGLDPKKATEIAANLGIRVYTVGIGTPQGGTVKIDGVNMRTHLEEAALQEIAKVTMGEYFAAPSGLDLKTIFQSLNARLTLEKPKQTEITALFAGLGALLLTVSALASVFRHRRVL